MLFDGPLPPVAGCLTIGFPAADADWSFDPPTRGPVRPPGARRDALPPAVGARARVLRAPRAAVGPHARQRRVVVPVPVPRRAGADVEAVVADVAASVRMKSAEVIALREQTLTEGEARAGGGGRGAARALRRGRPAARARQRRLGDRRDGRGRRLPPSAPAAWTPRPVLDLTEDAAILTALANDIGVEAIFARQVIAHGRPGDALLAISTSGGSGNVLAALAEARRRGMATIALVGYDGGEIAGGRARRPRHRHALPAHPADPGGPGERVPRAAGAGGVSAVRSRARVEGVVQGVGFRPFVHRLAGELRARRVRAQRRARRAGGGPGRAGAGGGVPRAAARRRAAAGRGRARAGRGGRARGGGRLRRSSSRARGGRPAALVSADVATCEDCLAELFDPADRRYRYPFLNCTNCGPRFTIVRGVPYDRPHTTMAGFAHVRGLPGRVRRTPATAASTPSRSPARTAGRGCAGGAARSREAPSPRWRGAARGAIVAIKGLGGFHLACVAADERAVAALRARKHREDKPFALMVARRRRGARSWWSWARRRSGCCARASGRSCSRRGGPARRWPTAVAPRAARARGDAALHAAAPPAARRRGRAARDDQRQRLRRADRLRGRGRAASAWPGSPTCCCSTTGRSTCAPTTRWCGSSRGRPLTLRRSRGYVPVERSRCPAPRRRRSWPAAPSSRARSASPGARARGSRTTSATCATPRRSRPSRTGSRTSSGCSTSRPTIVAHDLHPEYLSTKYALERDGDAPHRRPAPSRAPRGVPGRARRARARGRRDLRRHRLRRRRRRLGRRAAGRATGRLRARRAPAAGAHAGRRAGGPPAVADGVRVAAGGARRASPRRCRASTRRAGARSPRWRAASSPRR